MRAHQILIYSIIAVVALAGMYAVSGPEQYTAPTPAVVLTPILPEATTTPIIPTPKEAATTRTTPTAAASALGAEAAAPSPSADKAQTATIKIGDRSFSTPVHTGTKVMDAMQVLQATGQLTYTSQEYPGMGSFIDSINGKKNEGGKYWILYINETSSAVGASSAKMSPGDTVEWRYKNAY